eukprot:gene20642-biopygen2592
MRISWGGGGGRWTGLSSPTQVQRLKSDVGTIGPDARGALACGVGAVPGSPLAWGQARLLLCARLQRHLVLSLH